MWCRRAVNTLLCSALVILSLQSSAQAAIVSTDALVGPSQRPAATEPAQLVACLEALGVAPQTARQRVAALTPAERTELARRLERLPAGGDPVGALVFVGLVLLLTDVLGLTDVYPFVTHTVNGDKTRAKSAECPPAAAATASARP